MICLAIVPIPAGAQDMVLPDSGLSPVEVVATQLRALQQNDTPHTDAGILQTWILAHPHNKRVTGPLERFRLMINSPNYRTMINHRRHWIEAVVQTNERALFSVVILTGGGERRAFQWEVRKVQQGPHRGAWMTTAVSPPLRNEDST